ncbi:MAG: CCA tRNA nucleotidyltransferase [Planctomycetaceae bacterium]|nr:CCA tRNA nucleotidyltransferase [Planctomycetaceae bacterium]
MTNISPDKSREFATLVVERLRQAGYQTYWAGGCVRDEILGITPQDYDVATSAVPDQNEEVFSDRKTLAIGASFGVITVLGPRAAGQIEVATFRQDATYSDGRHPDRVSFTTAEEDASRRDFTINGMFFDPLENEVIDFVDGQADLERKLIRAIGDPQLRFAEDKLRILRAVRFAATFGFQIEPGTRAAIDQHAQELKVVSAERITAEMQRMLTHPGRSTAVQLLQETGLLAIIFPESEATQEDFRDRFQVALAGLEHLDTQDFASALALLWSQLVPAADRNLTESVMRRMKLSNEAIKSMTWMLDHESQVVEADTLDWPDLQRVLIDPRIEHLLALATARQQARQLPVTGIETCRQKQLLAPEKLNPPPLLSGNDLQEMGLPAGPLFREILEKVRNAQLMEQLQDKQQALEWVQSRWPG